VLRRPQAGGEQTKFGSQSARSCAARPSVEAAGPGSWIASTGSRRIASTGNRMRSHGGAPICSSWSSATWQRSTIGNCDATDGPDRSRGHPCREETRGGAALRAYYGGTEHPEDTVQPRPRPEKLPHYDRGGGRRGKGHECELKQCRSRLSGLARDVKSSPRAGWRPCEVSAYAKAQTSGLLMPPTSSPLPRCAPSTGPTWVQNRGSEPKIETPSATRRAASSDSWAC